MFNWVFLDKDIQTFTETLWLTFVNQACLFSPNT